jgi:hypothetical protein
LKGNDASILDQLQSVDDYFPLFTEQTLQLYALRMKDNEDQADIVVNRMKYTCFFLKRNIAFLYLG